MNPDPDAENRRTPSAEALRHLGADLFDVLTTEVLVDVHVLDRELAVVRSAASPARLELALSVPDVREALRTALATGEPVRDLHCPVRRATLSVSAFPLRGPDGSPLGLAATVTDLTARERAEHRVGLLEQASALIGSSLDVFRTAAELADVTVPAFADAVAVDVLDSVLHGEALAPGPLLDAVTVRRAAFAAVPSADVSAVHDLGGVRLMRRATPYADALADLTPRLVNDLAGLDQADWLARDPRRAELFRRNRAHAMLVLPLTARGVVLGMVVLYRAGDSDPFDDVDVDMAKVLAARAALCLDNARLYTRERTLARIAQRDLVPARVPHSRAVETAHTYLPVAAGGTWFDVIPLSGARVALVSGDVQGSGLRAATAMGQLRTAVHAFAAMDLEPAELLTRLHDLTARLAMEQQEGGARNELRAGCLYVVHDPVDLRCEAAAAAHPGPVVAAPGAPPYSLDVAQGPQLGSGTASYRTTSVAMPAGSLLALFNRGLVPGGDPTALERRLAALRDRPLRQLCDAMVGALLPDGPEDDALLLLARTRSLGPDTSASWTLPGDPRSAARARRLVAGRLAEWGLDGEVAAATELIVSELVTNAVRYASGPLGLRLIRDNALIVEVTDTNSASPHLRLAADNDEGGRGIYLVGRFADRWGTRALARGKAIWAEQRLD
ncbi:SpoIIE family protein phosphatase [Streptomyces sp. NPDC006458]|uniref:ATP-binding SpoIIE family protein phosphatase n=1 Tax=Streptomyces sp. NPDC006458 TaxID=3154302 RepID=UPI0033B3388D